MSWTTEQKLKALMRLPWSVTVERDEDEGYFVARVSEIPDVLATGGTEKELAADLWDALATSLGVRIDHEDPIPLPTGVELPWEGNARPRVPQKVVLYQKRTPAWDVQPSFAIAGGTRTLTLGK